MADISKCQERGGGPGENIVLLISEHDPKRHVFRSDDTRSILSLAEGAHFSRRWRKLGFHRFSPRGI